MNEAFAGETKAIEIQPDYETAWFTRGSAHLVLGHYQEAIRDLNRALELKPGDEAAKLALARAQAAEPLVRKPVEAPN